MYDICIYSYIYIICCFSILVVDVTCATNKRRAGTRCHTIFRPRALSRAVRLMSFRGLGKSGFVQERRNTHVVKVGLSAYPI